MSERPGLGNLLVALDVRRRAAIGFATGAVVALALYVFFVVVPGAPNRLRFVVLAFVLAVSLGLFVTAVLVGRAAWGRAKP